MTLFTKVGCTKCDYIKDQFQLDALGIKIEELSPNNPDALAHLAWHELVETAKKELPILVLDDNSSISGAIPIKKYLAGQADGKIRIARANAAQN
jgi:hypothetical protein